MSIIKRERVLVQMFETKTNTMVHCKEHMLLISERGEAYWRDYALSCVKDPHSNRWKASIFNLQLDKNDIPINNPITSYACENCMDQG